MEAAFSVATNNRFAFFMDDEDNPGDTVIDEAPSQAKPTPVKPRDIVDQQQQKADKSPKNKKKEIAKTKGAAQPVKNVEKKKEPTANEKLPNKDKTSSTPGSNDKPRGFRDNKTRVANSDRTGNDQRGSGNGGPPDNRQQRGQFRNRGRLPSKENQENAPTGVQDDQYNNDDNSSRGGRSRWNRERGDRQGFQGDRYNDRGEGERGQRPFRGRGGFRGGKREFERRSGNDKSSVKPIDKKEGGGAHNWGSVKDDIESNEWGGVNEESEPLTIAQPDDTNTDNNENVTNGDADDEAAVNKKDDETKEADNEDDDDNKEEVVPQLTLDEYKALQEKKRTMPLFKERRPGENEDQTRWKNTFVYERVEGEFFPGTREIVEKYKTSGRVKTTVESDFFFRDERRGGRGGGGGGRGGNRGGFGGGARREERREGGEQRVRQPLDDRRRDNDYRRNEGRRDDRGNRRGGSNRNRDRQFNVEDEKDFPSLATVSA